MKDSLLSRSDVIADVTAHESVSDSAGAGSTAGTGKITVIDMGSTDVIGGTTMTDRIDTGSFSEKKSDGPELANLYFPRIGTKYSKYQVDFNFLDLFSHARTAGVPDSAFNPDFIDISVTFEIIGDPHRKKKVNAFYMVDYLRDPDPTASNLTKYVPGDDYLTSWELEEPLYLQQKHSSWETDPAPWHVRFAPPEAGWWAFSFTVVLNGKYKGTFYYPGGEFEVMDSGNKGYVKAVKRNFRFGNGDIYFPIGITTNPQKIVNYNRIPFTYATYMFTHIARYKGNFTRLFATADRYGIEHEVLGNYAAGSGQQRAFDLDELVELAQSWGIYIQLCLEEKLEFTDFTEHDAGTPPADVVLFWDKNPYSTIDKQPRNFFSNKNSIAKYKQKLRYIIARWGYSTAICTFEFFNEVDLIKDAFLPSPPNAPSPVPDTLITWINVMINYCKNVLGDPHMYTTSFADGTHSEYPYYGHPSFMDRTIMDFYILHYYVTSDMQDHYINYLAARARFLYPDKPFIIGEFGGNRDYKLFACPDDGGADNEAPWAKDIFGYTVNYLVSGLHNALFTSVLSGCAGAVVNYFPVTNNSFINGTAYFPPLVHFLQGEDLDLANSIPIRNECCGTPVVLSETGKRIEYSCFPAWPYNDRFFVQPPLSELHEDMQANHPEVEAFALKYIHGPNKNKIIGWVNNCYYWWLNQGKNLSKPGEACYIPGRTVTTLEGIRLKISGLLCNATFRVEFHGVYPHWPLEPFGSPENGGEIPMFTYNTSSHCGTLIIDIPPMPALYADCGPYAPNYGFKIIPLVYNWGHGYIGNVTPPSSDVGLVPFAVNGDGTQIAFRGGDGSMQCYYRDNPHVYAWSLAPIGPGGSGGVKNGGAIARGASSTQVYYHGADDRLQVAYWDGSHWAHVWLTDWRNTSQNVAGDIACAAPGGKIFYRGADGELHMYLWDTSSGWQHSIHSLIYKYRPAPETNFAVSADGTFVAYKCNKGFLVFVWYDASSHSYKDDFHTGEIVSGLVRMNSAGNVLFYRGFDGLLHQVYYESGGWHSRIIVSTWGAVSFNGPFDIKPDSTKDDAQVYFRGADGFMQVVFVSGGVWVQGPVITMADCGPEPADRQCMNGGYIRYASGTVIYDAMKTTSTVVLRHRFDLFTRNFQAYHFNKCDAG